MFSDIDRKYAYDGNDLGFSYSPEKTRFKVWAPLADKAAVCLYRTCRDEKPYRHLPMTKDKKGVWSKDVYGNLDGVYYTYVITNGGVEQETIPTHAFTSCISVIFPLTKAVTSAIREDFLRS